MFGLKFYFAGFGPSEDGAQGALRVAIHANQSVALRRNATNHRHADFQSGCFVSIPLKYKYKKDVSVGSDLHNLLMFKDNTNKEPTVFLLKARFALRNSNANPTGDGNQEGLSTPLPNYRP